MKKERQSYDISIPGIWKNVLCSELQESEKPLLLFLPICFVFGNLCSFYVKISQWTRQSFSHFTPLVYYPNITVNPSAPVFITLLPFYTGFFDRNVIFKLSIFQPKNQYFSETKYVLNRLLLDILKIKCSLHNMNKENCEIN